MTRFLKIFLLLAWLAPAQTVFAETELEKQQAEEAKRAKIFETSFKAIVDDLNAGEFKLLVRAINKGDMLDRIFGLRLIDSRLKRDFREDMTDGKRFASYIESYYQTEAKDGIRAKLLLVESRGDRGRAVVRFDMAHFQVNYIEYDLSLDGSKQMVVDDWTDYLWGHKFSDRMGLSMIQAQPNESAARKLIDYPSAREQEIFQITEILKASRDRNFDRYMTIYGNLGERLKRQRVVLKVGLDATRQSRKRRAQRTILESIAKYYPDDPLFALALLDYYFPSKQYEKALAALLRVRDRLRIEDSVMNARLSSATLVLKQLDEANAYAQKSVEQEPELELGWWAVMRAQVAAERYADALPAMDKLKNEFGHALDPEMLRKDRAFTALIQSSEYKGWLEKNGS